MIQLIINGKVVDYGTKPDVALYVKLGYDVRVLNKQEEVEEHRAKLYIKNIWAQMPTPIKKHIAPILRDDGLTWIEKKKLMVFELDALQSRVDRIHVVHQLPRVKKEWTITEQLQGVVDDVKSLVSTIKSVFTPQQAWQLQLARA